MSVGLSLLRCVLENSGPATFLADNGLKVEDFTSDEQVIVNYIESHITRYSCIPAIETVQVETSIELPEIPQEPLSFWVDGLKNRTFSIKTRESINVATKLLQTGKTTQLIDHLKSMSAEALDADTATSSKDLVDVFRTVKELHDKRQNKTSYDVMEGVPFGFPYIDEVSDGIQRGDTIAILGTRGIGKSYLLCKMANSAHEAGKVPLLISMEMSSVQLGRRLLALRTGVNETRIRKGQLMSFIGSRAIDTEIAAVEGNPTKFHLLDGGLVLKVEDLELYIKSLKPDAVYVDGAYLLKTRVKTNSRWEVIAEVAESLKAIAMKTGIPVIASYQLNKEGYVFGSKTVEQLSSIMLQLSEQRDDRGGSSWMHVQTKIITITKGRYGEKGRISVSFDMAKTAIEQVEVLAGYVIQQEDTNDEEDFDYDNERIS